MKIWGEIPKIFGIYDKAKNVGKVDKTATVSSKRDVVSISNEAKDYQTIMKAMKDIPDIRPDKINELASKYESGSYDVSGRDIADKLLKSVVDKKA